MADHDCVLSQKADVNVETAAEEEAKVPDLDQAIAAFIATSLLERLRGALKKDFWKYLGF